MNADPARLAAGANAAAARTSVGAGAVAPDVHDGDRFRVVTEDGRRRARRVRLLVWSASAVVALAVFGAVAFHVFVAQTQVRLDELSKSIARAQHEYELARLDVAQARSPATIIDRAHKLGMVEPDHVTYVNAPSPTADDAGPAQAWASVKPYLAPQP